MRWRSADAFIGVQETDAAQDPAVLLLDRVDQGLERLLQRGPGGDQLEHVSLPADQSFTRLRSVCSMARAARLAMAIANRR